MRRYFTVPAFVLAFVGISVLASLIAPERTRAAGLDFWNHTKECALLHGHKERRRDLELEQQQILNREAVYDQVTLSFCERRISLSEALDDLAVLAESNPRWWACLRNQYQFLGIPLSASDREALTLTLRNRIETFLSRAVRVGDRAREAEVAARLDSFDEEVRELNEERAIAQAKP